MPLTIRFSHPDCDLVTLHNVTKVEGVWMLPKDGRPTTVTHYCLYTGHDPYIHQRYRYLVPVGAVQALHLMSEAP